MCQLTIQDIELKEAQVPDIFGKAIESKELKDILQLIEQTVKTVEDIFQEAEENKKSFSASMQITINRDMMPLLGLEKKQ